MAKTLLLASASLLAFSLHAQETSSTPELPDLPAINPTAPVPDMGLVPAAPQLPVPSSRPMPSSPALTEEQRKAAEADRNWAVNAVKARQEEAAARAAETQATSTPLPGFEGQDELSRALDPLRDLRDGPKTPTSQPGELGTFRPAIQGNEPAPTTAATLPQPTATPAANPLTSTPSAQVRPLVGPPPSPEMNLPTHGRSQPPGPNTVKLSSDPNFVPEGFLDPLGRLQQEQAAATRTNVNQANLAPEPRRPTYRDLRRQIPNPSDRPPF